MTSEAGSSSAASQREIRIWGLTGGIASGKSAVAKILAEAGIPVIDADAVARELRAPGGAAYQKIIERFGTDDPKKLREIVFADEQAKKDLEGILHPLIRQESQKRIEKAAHDYFGRTKAAIAPVIYEATLLIETGRFRDFHGLIVVHAPETTRIERIISRDGNPRELAEKIIASQLTDDERLEHATRVIENSGDFEDLRRKTLELIPSLIS